LIDSYIREEKRREEKRREEIKEWVIGIHIKDRPIAYRLQGARA
jgi:hypothetical protein